jgi:hypothetical protein
VGARRSTRELSASSKQARRFGVTCDATRANHANRGARALALRSQCLRARTHRSVGLEITMNKLILSLVSTLGLSIAGAGVATASPTCTPDIKVDYVGGAGSSIKVLKIKYRLDGTHKWHVEELGNRVIDKGKSHTFKSQRLGSVAKGQKIDLLAVYLEDDGKGYGTKEHESPIRNSGKECENNVTYDIDVKP